MGHGLKSRGVLRDEGVSDRPPVASTSCRRMIRPETTVPHPVPVASSGLHNFSPLDEKGPSPCTGTRGDSMGSEWGLRPLTIGGQLQKSRRSTGSPRAGSEGDGNSPPAVGSGRRAEICGDTGAMVHIASRTSEQTAPNLGTSWRGTLGEDGRPDERSDGGADGTGAPG
jgi:hypothetical protein